MLLNRYQQRDGLRVLKLSHALSPQQIYLWMRQLSFAATGLEELGLTHGDIRPGNMLLDLAWNLKLSDIDRVMKIGERIAVTTEPFGRLLGKEVGEDADGHGNAGTRTETFAIGSVYYILTRGYEPYETEFWGQEHYIVLSEKLQNKEFPSLTDSATDFIISKCWDGECHSVKDLLAEFADGTELGDLAIEEQEWLESRQAECEVFIKSGSVDTLVRY